MLPVSADAGAVLSFDAFVPVPDQVVVEVVDEFVDALVLVVLVVVELLFEAAEEALERGQDRFEQPLVPPGPVKLFEVVVERAACDACLCSIRDCGFSHVKVSGLVMGACRPLLQGLV